MPSPSHRHIYGPINSLLIVLLKGLFVQRKGAQGVALLIIIVTKGVRTFEFEISADEMSTSYGVLGIGFLYLA